MGGKGQRGQQKWTKCTFRHKHKAIQKAPQRDQGKLISALFLVKCMTVLADHPMVDLSTQIRKPFGRYGCMWTANDTQWILSHNNIISHIKTSRGFCGGRPTYTKVLQAKCIVCSPAAKLYSNTKMFWGHCHWHKLHKDIKAFATSCMHSDKSRIGTYFFPIDNGERVLSAWLREI